MQHGTTSTDKGVSVGTFRRTCRSDQRSRVVGRSRRDAGWRGVCVGLGRVASWRSLSVAMEAFRSSQQIAVRSSLGRTLAAIKAASQRAASWLLSAEARQRTNGVSGSIVGRCVAATAGILSEGQMVDLHSTWNAGQAAGDIEMGQEVVYQFGNPSASLPVSHAQAHCGDEAQSGKRQRFVAGPISHGPHKSVDNPNVSDGREGSARVEQSEIKYKETKSLAACCCLVA